MTIRRLHSARLAALSLSFLVLSGCTGLGTFDDVLGAVGGSHLSGEVRGVDTRRQELRLRTGSGRTETLDFDRDTRVVYRQQRYSVGALERGDRVSVQVQRGRRGRAYAGVIRVERSAREGRGGRGGEARREQTFEGRVGRIDHRRGSFELREGDRRSYTVLLPARPARSIADRFRRLRSGDRVRIQGELLARERVELRRFR